MSNLHNQEPLACCSNTSAEFILLLGFKPRVMGVTTVTFDRLGGSSLRRIAPLNAVPRSYSLSAILVLLNDRQSRTPASEGQLSECTGSGEFNWEATSELVR